VRISSTIDSVPPHGGRGGVRVAPLDRRDDRLVFGDEGVDLARQRQMEAAQPVDMAAVPTDERPPIGDPRGVVEILVEGAVGRDEAHIIARRRQRLLPSDRAVCGGDAAGRVVLDREPQTVGLAVRADVAAGHNRRMLREDRDEALLLELDQCVAHGGLADAELGLQVRAGQKGARGQLERRDATAQKLEDLRGGLPRSVRPRRKPMTTSRRRVLKTRTQDAIGR
jgi:hypothetical protein